MRLLQQRCSRRRTCVVNGPGSWLRAVNTGHPGSMTTIHADTPQRALEQLALLVLQTGSRLSRDDVRHYVRESIDVFVQLERREGRRRVTQVMVAD